MSETRTYYPTIGLEIHAELVTATKMFCRCANNPFDSEPNAHVCPVCMAHPGTLPVPNRQVIEHVVNVGLAVGGTIANFSEFDRKNYFYPDIPKGYQISQYKYPIVSGGTLAGVDITRIHLEEDTATSQHSGDSSLVNYNRAGVPLMELVTEPVIHSADQAMAFAQELQLLLRTLGVSTANMEKGEMRVEVNFSLSPDPEKFGTKIEVKNINSFSAAGRAIAYETKRMTELYEAGREAEIVQETRGWDDVKQCTFSQRKKEGAADYRYFPEPDIPKFYLHEMFDLDVMKNNLPELPWEMRNRYRTEYGIKDEDIESYVTDRDLATLFQNTIIVYSDDKDLIRLTSNIITGDVIGFMRKGYESDIEGMEGKEKGKFLSFDEKGENVSFKEIHLPEAEKLSSLVRMKSEEKVNSRGVKDILLELMTDSNEIPLAIAERLGLLQQHDEGALRTIAEQVIADNAQSVADYKAGKENAIKFLVGQGMKASKGSANPAVLEKVIKEIIIS